MRSFFGATLLGCGILVGGLAGLCTLFFLGSAMIGEMGREEMMYLPAFLIVSGAPFVIGVGMFFAGRHLMRKANQEAAASLPPAAPPAAPPPAQDNSPQI